jgi:predicted nucleic acid-binding Zn ribbon protein
VTHTTSGDKPVDSVDNLGRSSPIRSTTKPQSRSDVTRTDVPGSSLVGPELARAALAAARARHHAARKQAQGKKVPTKDAAEFGRRRRRRWSGPRADDRDPQTLGQLAAGIAARRGWSQQLQDGQVFSRWPQLVGPDLALHAKPVTLRDGELTVVAESTAWATQIRTLQSQLLARFASVLGNGVVTKLRVQGPAAPSWKHGPRAVRGRGPRDTYG